MRLLPIEDNYRLEVAAGDIMLNRGEALEFARLADQLREQSGGVSLAHQKCSATSIRANGVGVMLSLDEHHAALVMQIFGVNGERISFDLSEEVARNVREQLDKKIELIEGLRENSP